MAGSKHNIERCLVCGLLLTSNGLCPTCDADKLSNRATIPDIDREIYQGKKTQGNKKASKNTKSTKGEEAVEFKATKYSKTSYLENPAFLFNKTTKERYELSRIVSKVGRDQSNNISIAADSHISRYHAWIFHNKGKFWVEDLGSTNGTMLNGKPITNRVELTAGDRVTFGKTELIFVVD